jgi:hypothetical protein
MSQYTVDYFIAKFEAIPEELWTIGDYVDQAGRCCALGHCGIRYEPGKSCNEEGDALVDLFKLISNSPPQVNDHAEGHYTQPNAKQRILAALHDIKAKEAQCSH